jgi:hypothetical protein
VYDDYIKSKHVVTSYKSDVAFIEVQQPLRSTKMMITQSRNMSLHEKKTENESFAKLLETLLCADRNPDS